MKNIILSILFILGASSALAQQDSAQDSVKIAMQTQARTLLSPWGGLTPSIKQMECSIVKKRISHEGILLTSKASVEAYQQYYNYRSCNSVLTAMGITNLPQFDLKVTSLNVVDPTHLPWVDQYEICTEIMTEISTETRYMKSESDLYNEEREQHFIDLQVSYSCDVVRNEYYEETASKNSDTN